MHVHTNVSSPCSLIDPRQMIERAIEIGLDAVCVTEHEEIGGAQVAQELGAELGFKVFKGIEIYTEYGDMLVYGLYRDAPGWKTPFARLLSLCSEVDAVIVPAHPCRIPGELESVHGEEAVAGMMARVVAVETRNGGCTPRGNLAAMELASRYGLPGIGGSDAHHLCQVGRCGTDFPGDIATDEELVEALRRGGYSAYCRQVRAGKGDHPH
jgi:hypothetical protein